MASTASSTPHGARQRTPGLPALPALSAWDSRAINRTDPQAAAAALRERLAGPPETAAAALRVAAEGGVVQAQLTYGQWLLDGHGVDRDPAQAVQWFQHASRHGEPMALNMLGQCHAHGWGVAPNPVMAAYWFRLAALGGLDWGMYNYATALSLGQGVDVDRAAALAWFRRAAAQGHAKSINLIGSFYEDGWVVARDEDTALDYYQRAGAGGDFRGQFNAARLLIARGQPGPAIAWLKQVPDTATPAFLDKAARWLLAQPHAALHTIARQYLARPRHYARDPTGSSLCSTPHPTRAPAPACADRPDN